MKMKELIDRVSEIYREGLAYEHDLRNELYSVSKALLDVEFTKGEHITLAEYNHLTERKEYLENQIALQVQYCEGISDAREILMDFGFDTEVK